MKVAEKCLCGAEIKVEDYHDNDRVERLVREWRQQHEKCWMKKNLHLLARPAKGAGGFRVYATPFS